MIPGAFVMGVWLLLPPVLFYFFRPHVAAMVTLLSSTLFLPEGVRFDLPLLPPMAKDEVSSIVCALCCLAFAPGPILKARLFRWPDVLIIVLCVGTIISTLTNGDTLRFGMFVEPGAEPTAAVAAVLWDLMTWGFPFLIGRVYFTTSKEIRDLFVILVFAGLFYSLLMLIELRMSPQFHRWTYGYHQHSFAQTLRGDGSFRPMVYMRHGLNLALFTVMGLSSAWILSRTRYSLPVIAFMPKIAIASYLTVVLLLCRSTAATLYTLTIVPLLYFATSRLQARAAVVIAVLTLVYPAVRVAQLLPVEELVQLAEEQFGQKRAESLAGRLRTEEQLTSRIQTRPAFGWAHAGRAMVRDEFTGENRTTYDGTWLVQFVSKGTVGYLALFGLLLAPVFQAYRRIGAIRSKQERNMVAGLALMVSIHVFDLIPNSTTESYLTVMSGALSASVVGILSRQGKERSSRVEPARRGPDSRDPNPRTKPGRDELASSLGKELLGSAGPEVLRRPREP